MAPTEDDSAHVVMRERVEGAMNVMLSIRFVEDARARCDRAEAALVSAHAEAEAALDYLNRALVTTEQAIRVHAMRRR